MNYMCSHCDEAIPAGLAVIRSIRFERVVFHGHCWDLVSAAAAVAAAPVVPVQRRGGGLSERLAEAAGRAA